LPPVVGAADAGPVGVPDRLAAARDAVLGGANPATPPRGVVTASWSRSLAAKVDPDAGAPALVYEPTEVARVRAAHPLAVVLPLLRDTLVSIADEAMQMMIVTDERGHILWREGQRDVLRGAERVGLVEGARWSEESIGTNAMGTALAADQPVQIHSAEHLVRTYHTWTCAAAPIHDPETGAVVGVVDVTGRASTFHPTTLALVVAAARLAEGFLRTQLAMRDEQLLTRNLPHLVGLRGEPGALLSANGRVLAAQPSGLLPARIELPAAGDRVVLADGDEGLLQPLAEGWLLRLPRSRGRRRRVLAIAFLGAARPLAYLDGHPVRLSRRHAELLTVLALHPEGRTADELATALYGDAGKAVTARAEIHRLRSVVGDGVLRTQPYRLDARVEADFLSLRTALTEGRVREGVQLHRGELLPRSDAPAVRDERELLVAAVRGAVLRSGDVEALWSYLASADRHDDEVVERLLDVLPADDVRRAALAVRADGTP
jgi:GAF domain